MLLPNTKENEQRIAVIGSGDLVSHIIRSDEKNGLSRYRFNILRLSEDLEATHDLRPSDLRDIVKLCQVLTFAILDDGWADSQAQQSLLELNEQLDELTQTWAEGGE